MKDNLNQKSIRKELELVFQSSQFVNSEKERKLLDYLVEKSLANESIKEAHIAIDIFNRENDFDPALDSTVRVYVGKLRKKLETFYLSDESENSSLKITIPKGHYSVIFEKLNKKKRINRLKLLSNLFMVIAVLLLLLFALHIFNEKNNLFSNSKAVSQNPVWRDYTKSNLPTLLVVGDFFFMRKRIGGSRYFIRNGRINSLEDMRRNSLDTAGFEMYRYTYTPSDMSKSILGFIPHLINNKKQYSIKQASQLTWEDVNSNNIIFVGDFKTLNILSLLLPRFNINYDSEQRSYFLLDDNKKVIDKFDFNRDNEGYRNEHIIVTKRPGGNNNTIMLILALGRGGIDDVTQKLCDNDFLKHLVKTYKKDHSKKPFYFDLVFKIEGVEGTPLKTEIAYFNQIFP